MNSAPRRSARPPPPREPKPDQGPAVSWAHGSDAAAAAAAVATTNDDNEDGGQLTDESKFRFLSFFLLLFLSFFFIFIFLFCFLKMVSQ